MPGVAITSPLPTVGVTTGPDWATQLKNWCDEVEADLEALIVPSEININAALDCNGNKLTEVGGARFNSLSSASTGSSNSSMLEVVSGDLYFIDGDGTSIRVTSGGTLSFTTTGGIGGDYPTSAAEVTYSDSNTEYTFLDQNATARAAGINCGIIRLREETATSNAISLKSPDSLASAYNFIFPAAVGSGTQVMLGTTSGSNLTLSMSSSLSLSGTITATSGMKFKDTGSGSDTLSHYQDEGSTSELRAFDPIIIDGAATISYIKRYAYYQKIGGWVNAFVSIIFESDATVTSTGEPKVRGLPWKAKGDAIGVTTGNIVACGVCANFPPANLGAQSGYVAAASISVADYSTGSGAINVNSLVSFAPQVTPVMVDDNADVYFLSSGVMNSTTASENNEWDGATIPPTSSGTPLVNAANWTLSTGSNQKHFITFSISYRAGAAV